MIWSGAGLHGTILLFFLLTWLGLDPDGQTTAFFLALAPLLLIGGGILMVLSGYLDARWEDEENRGWGFKLNRVAAALKCDFCATPTLFFIPMPLLSIVSLLISLVTWIGVFK
jgi:hypothetical protein